MDVLDSLIDRLTSSPPPRIEPAADTLPPPEIKLREVTDELSEQYRTYLRGVMGLSFGETQLQVLSGGLDVAA